MGALDPVLAPASGCRAPRPVFGVSAPVALRSSGRVCRPRWSGRAAAAGRTAATGRAAATTGRAAASGWTSGPSHAAGDVAVRYAVKRDVNRIRSDLKCVRLSLFDTRGAYQHASKALLRHVAAEHLARGVAQGDGIAGISASGDEHAALR